MTEKSILEQALLQVNTLEEAVKQNAKGILSSVMKKELNELLKESEEVEEEEGTIVAPEEEESKDMSEQPADDEADDDNEEIPSINDEPSKDIDGDDMDSEMGDEMEPEMDDEMEPEMDDMPDFGSSDDDMLDMTGASDEEVLKVFKAMSDEDGIIVKKDGENIELQDGDDEYIIKLNESEDEAYEEMSDEEMSEEWNDDEMAEEDETVYEIELDEEEEVDLEASEVESKEIEATEASRSMAFGQKGLESKKIFKAGRKEGINEELQVLKNQNNEYKKALVLFKDKLNEVAVFNANLAHATRLFTEHTTTKKEKHEH
jgi:hypothetical protein